jgi:hypothetical protein
MNLWIMTKSLCGARVRRTKVTMWCLLLAYSTVPYEFEIVNVRLYFYSEIIYVLPSLKAFDDSTYKN